LQQIDENQRDVIILRFLVGLSLQEAAHALDKSVGAIKTLQHRGILALRVALQVA
jgi:RNA polymerase sigma-70 factor, ECF subfamily